MLPFPSPGDLPNQGIKSWFPALRADSLPTELQGKPKSLQRQMANALGKCQFVADGCLFPLLPLLLFGPEGFFDEWNCVLLLLVVQPEISSNEVCRQLGKAESWFSDMDFWDTAL